MAGQRTGDVDLSRDPIDAEIDSAIDEAIARRKAKKERAGLRAARDVAAEAIPGLPNAGIFAGDLLGAGAAALRGMAQGASSTRIAWNELTGDKAEADRLRKEREQIDEFAGGNLSGFDTAANVGGRLAYEVGEYAAPGAILGKAAEVAKLGKVAKVLKPASKAGKIAVNTALAAPLNVTKAADRENSTAGALAELTGNETLENVASSKLGRGILEVGVDALGNTVGELAHGALRGRKLRKLRAERAEKAAARAAASSVAGSVDDEIDAAIAARGQLEGGSAAAGDATLRPREITHPGLTEEPSSALASSPPAAEREISNVSPSTSQVPTEEAANRSTLDPSVPAISAPTGESVPTNKVTRPRPGVQLNDAGQPEIVADLLRETPAGRARLAVRDRHLAQVGEIPRLSDKTWKNPVKTGEELYAMAEQEQPSFWQQVREWGQAAGKDVAGYIDPGLKPRESFLDKLERKKAKANALGFEPAEKIGDVLRGSIVVKDPAAAAKIIEKIKASGALVELDDFHANPTGFGYGAIHTQVRLPSGLMAEVQIHTEHGWEARRRLGGHDLYDLYEKSDRDAISSPEQLARLADDVEYGRQLYGEAHDRALRGEPVSTSERSLHYNFEKGRWEIHNGDALEVEDAGKTIRAARAELDALEGGHAAGRESRVIFPGGKKVGVRYSVREADALVPSHNPHSFEPNPAYPAGVQGRAYHGAHGTAARQAVETNTGNLDPERLLDPGFRVSGPPIITPAGIAVAGNQRTMILQRAARMAPEKFAAYRQQLEELAPTFGINPDKLAKMKNPVLVRELADAELDHRDPAVLRELNRLSDTPEVKAKDVVSEGSSRAAALQESPTSLAHFAQTFDPEGTLRSYLDTAHGREFVKALASDGVIQPQELGRYVDAASGTLTRPGKQLIEDMLYGAAIGSPDVVATAPDAALRKLEHAIPSMVAASRTPGWDLAEPMRQAFEILNAKSAAGAKSVDVLLAQGDLLERGWTENAQNLARLLDGDNKKAVTDTFRRYAEAAAEAAKHDGGADMFGNVATPDDALAQLTGREAASSSARTGAIGELPPRSSETMVDAIALASPNGRMSKRARAAANERLRTKLFGENGLEAPTAAQPSERERLLAQAKQLRELASRGQNPRKYVREAARLEARAAQLEGRSGRIGDDMRGGELGVRMMGSISGSGIGGAAGYRAGMSSDGTDEERRQRALAWAIGGAALGAGLPWADRSLRAALHAAQPVADVVRQGVARKVGEFKADLADEARALGHYEHIGQWDYEPRRGAIGDMDLFGNVERGTAAEQQGGLFDAATSAPRTLSAEEKAARSRIPRLRQELELLDKQIERHRNTTPQDARYDLHTRATGQLWKQRDKVTRELAQLEKLVNRGEKIGSDELSHDLFGNRTGAIGQQPEAAAAAAPVTAAKVAPPAPVDPEQFARLSKFGLDTPGEERLSQEIERVVREEGLSPKQRVTWEETKKIAAELGQDPASFIHKERLNGPELLAVRNLVKANVEHLVAIEHQLAAPGLADVERAHLEELRGKLEGSNDALLGRFVRERSRSGRDLNNLKIVASQSMDPVYWLTKAKRELGDQPMTDEIRSIILEKINQKDRDGLARAVAKLRKVTLWDKGLTLWKAGLLTAPTTHIANTIGNVSMAALETAKEAPAAAFDAALSVVTGARTKAGLSASTMRASAEGAIAGAKEAAQVMRRGMSADALGKLDLHHEIDFKNPILDTYTKTIFRSLSAADRVFRGMALRRSLENQARVIARAERLGGTARKARVAQLLAAPTDEMAVRAVSDAEIATFQNNGVLARVATAARRPLGPVGDIILPFARTPANVASRVAEYSPLGAASAASKILVAAMKGKGIDRAVQREAADRLGRSATGAGAIAIGYYLAAHGKLNAGRPTQGSAKADEFDLEGKTANSVLINGKWRSLNRFSPVGNLLALGAHIYNAEQEPDATASSVAMRTLTGIGQSVEEQSFLQGFSTLTDAAKGAPGATERYGEQLAGSIIPTGVARVAQTIDPTVRETHGPADALMARTPFLSKRLPAKVNQLGEDVTREGGAAGAFLDPSNSRADRRASDELVAEFARVGAQVTRLKRQKGESPRAYENRQRVYGQALDQVLRQVIASDDYRGIPALAQQLVETQPALAGRDPKELAKELQRSQLEDATRTLRRYLTYERNQAAADAGAP